MPVLAGQDASRTERAGGEADLRKVDSVSAFCEAIGLL